MMMMGNYLSDYSAFPSSMIVHHNSDRQTNEQKTTTNASNNPTEVMDANNNNNTNNNNNNNNNNNSNNKSTAIASSVRRSSDSLIAPSPSPTPSPAPAIASSSYTSDQPYYDYEELYRASTIYPQRVSPHQTSVPTTHPIVINGHCMHTDLIHTHPRILAVHNFLSPDECDAIIRSAEPRLKRSGVGMLVDQSSGMEQSSISARRTSSTAGFARQENQLIALIEARLMALVACPLENIEPLQVVSYAPGQFYKAHYDTKPADHLNSYDGGLRLHTILVYLTEHDNDDSHLFDNNHNNNNPSMKSSSSVSSKPSSRSPSPPPPLYHGKHRAPSGSTFFPKLGLRIRPTKGMAIWWRNVLPASKESALSSSSSSSGYVVDTRTLHAGEPPISGKKYAINCWIREKPFVVSINNATAVHSPAPIPIIQVNHHRDDSNSNNTSGEKNNGSVRGNQHSPNSNSRRVSLDLIDDMHLHQQNINPSNHKPASSHY